MSNLQNQILIDRLVEAFDDAIYNDYDLRSTLAYHLLDSMEYYLFCKDDRSEYLDDRSDEIYSKIEEQFFSSDIPNFDIRDLAERAYDIERGE